jgi:2-polyprenyl-3-methyl-5-hydroxy-6-metoxy-1,4-benzoquinol methylase
MEAESMVHALEQIHNLLKPTGHLVDIHPNSELNEFILPLEGREHFIGHMQETDDYIEYRQADEALQTATEKGLFQILKTGEFEFRTYADSIDALKAFIEASWSDAVVTEEVVANAKRLEKEFGERRVFLRERARIGLLKVL